jgi:hypothetical protein
MAFAMVARARAELERRRRMQHPTRKGTTPPTDWREWLKTLFAKYFFHPLGARHFDFWKWVLGIKVGVRPRPFVGVWPRGSGKALEVSTPIPTPDGWRAIGDLKVGDIVFAHDGSPVRVITVSEPTLQPCSEVRFRGGASIIASDDHLWTALHRATRRAMLDFNGSIPPNWPQWSGVGLTPQRGTCSVDGCDIGLRKGTLCSAHAERLRKHGDVGTTVITRHPAAHGTTACAETLTTAQLMARGIWEKDERQWAIPVASPIQTPAINLPIDPYVLGVWLGDGHSNGGRITIGSEDLDATTANLRAAGCTFTSIGRTNTAYLAGIEGLHAALRTIGLTGNKHIPDAYLRAGTAQRMALLQGLMDTDGTVDSAAAGTFTNTNERLAFGLHELAASLGFRVSITEGRAKLNGKDCGPVWDVRIAARANAPLFRLPRKTDLLQSYLDRAMTAVSGLHYIDDITPVGERMACCIGVDHPDHLYLAGREMIPTHNSTSAEVAVVALGVRGRRKYCLYVRETQDQADKSVANIASLLESDAIARYYPEHASRQTGKYGNSRGWRREQLRTAGGYTVDALGLDTAARGIKVDEQRPDLIIFDDIDGKNDSPATTKKKLETITHSILPAGSQDVAVLGIQNLIIAGGIFTQLAEGTADFLVDRIVSGPFPAVDGLEYEWQADPRSGVRRAVITSGTATWEGQNLATCQKQIDTFGLSAFLKECQHRVTDKAEGVALRFDAATHGVDLSDDACRDLVKRGRAFGGMDFGAWRFGFVLFTIDQNRVPTCIDEYFSQGESLTTRAQYIHEMCSHYGISGMMPIWGDAANPTDIREINDAFRRGWKDAKGNTVTSKLRVVAVAGGDKARKTAVDRINDALDRRALRFRRVAGYEWFYAKNSTSEGTAKYESRLFWELDAWSYPITKAGEAQDQNPDDDTADGADMIAATRYALMSHWKGAKLPVDLGVYENDRAEPFDYAAKKFKEVPHMVDPFMSSSTSRRTPRVNVPRARIGR